MKIKYSVVFKNNGKITALHLEILVNAGAYPDVSVIIPRNISATLRKYDWGALSLDVKVSRTNHPSRSAMRAPGDLQGSFIADVLKVTAFRCLSFIFVFMLIECSDLWKTIDSEG